MFEDADEIRELRNKYIEEANSMSKEELVNFYANSLLEKALNDE